MSDAAHHSNPEEVELTEAAESIVDCLTRTATRFNRIREPKGGSSKWEPKLSGLVALYTPTRSMLGLVALYTSTRRRRERYGEESATAVPNYISVLHADEELLTPYELKSTS